MTLNQILPSLPLTAQEMINDAKKYNSKKHIDFKIEELEIANEIRPYSVYINDFTLASATIDVKSVSGIENNKNLEQIKIEFQDNVGEVYINTNLNDKITTNCMSFYNTESNKIHNCPRLLGLNKFKKEKIKWTWSNDTGLITYEEKEH